MQGHSNMAQFLQAPPRDSLNSAAGKLFGKMPRGMFINHREQVQGCQTRAKDVVARYVRNSSTQAVSSDDAELKGNNFNLKPESNVNKNRGGNVNQSNFSQNPTYRDQFVTANTASTSGSGTLPGNTVTNPREDLKGITTRSGVAYQGPPIPTSSVEKPIPEVTKDQVHPSCSQSTAPVQPPPTLWLLDFEPDPVVTLILGMCFLKTGRALMMCQVEFPSRILDPIVATSVSYPYSFGDSDFLLLEEADSFLGLADDPDCLSINPSYYDHEGDILY
ncbi:hypothetical protein Tco_0556420 [Tanacetum coccineum]